MNAFILFGVVLVAVYLADLASTMTLAYISLRGQRQMAKAMLSQWAETPDVDPEDDPALD